MPYSAPTADYLFLFEHLLAPSDIRRWPGGEDLNPLTFAAVLAENGKLASDLLAPLNAVGDRQGARWVDGDVHMPSGFKAAFDAYTGGGWQGLQHPVEFGGQALPKFLAGACMENINAANLSFALCPLLTDGAIEALLTAGSHTQKQRYIPRLIAGEWTGTMNLTEPQAGSDLAQVQTRAVPQADGSYRLTGQKIFITYGDHDLAANIIHLVLARTPDAPLGVKGLSLFIVPKLLIAADETLGERNAVFCRSIEHKLGIHASPTAVLAFDGAVGELIGQENAGLQYMFVMMNAARFAVGLQGIGIADRAYQQALDYARERVQSRPVDGSSDQPVPIAQHPDIKRLLLTMQASVEAARALACWAAYQHDVAQHADEPAVRRQAKTVYEFLVPIVKGCSTEMAVEVASMALQVHGGAGYIEEIGAAQYYRDARILPIYEGTTAIQANDLLSRKTVRDQAATVHHLLGMLEATVTELNALGGVHEEALPLAEGLQAAAADWRACAEYLCVRYHDDINTAFAGAVPFLRMSGVVLGAWSLTKAWAAGVRQPPLATDSDFLSRKGLVVRFFVHHLLPQTGALRHAVLHGRLVGHS